MRQTLKVVLKLLGHVGVNDLVDKVDFGGGSLGLWPRLPEVLVNGLELVALLLPLQYEAAT